MAHRKEEWVPESIIGERVFLCPITLDDAPIIVEKVNDPVLREKLKYFSFFQEPLIFERETAYLKRMIDSQNDLIMVIKLIEGKKFIGTVGLHEIDWLNDHLRFGIIIFDKDFWGGGYGREAVDLMLDFSFEELNMNKVYLASRTDNAVAIGVYQKLGFKVEGVLRQEYRINKTEDKEVRLYLDLLKMSILKSEWREETKNTERRK